MTKQPLLNDFEYDASVQWVIVYAHHARSVSPNGSMKANLQALDKHKDMRILDSGNDMSC